MTSLHPSSTKEDILEFLLKHGEATASALANHFKVSAQAIRRHLKDLEAEALIEHQSIQEGMGRPNNLYRLSRRGRERFPGQYDQFAVSLLDALNETVGKEQMSTVLRKQWERKAQEYQHQLGNGSLAERVERLVELRKREGYMAEWRAVEPEAEESAPQYLVEEYNCAISQIAESFPTVCGHELEMFEVALPDCDVTRTHWQAEGEHRCGYLIQAKADAKD
ncbi:iron-sulfur cluster biosynthesis transcriptional regulator SufR [filamentous cyanobacterium CCP5]|nr:iron-sulfur cluster biosynthesis transcriptional regulator SufR [filamentous cyanobacterium CCP5]